jgi:hypothetical protein
VQRDVSESDEEPHIDLRLPSGWNAEEGLNLQVSISCSECV